MSRADIAHSCAAHLILCTSMWIKKAWLPCWPSRSQQVLHQRLIWGIHCKHAMEQASEGSTWLWNPEQTSPVVQNRGISGPTKWLVSSKNCKPKIFEKEFCLLKSSWYQNSCPYVHMFTFFDLLINKQVFLQNKIDGCIYQCRMMVMLSPDQTIHRAFRSIKRAVLICLWCTWMSQVWLKVPNGKIMSSYFPKCVLK